MPASPREQLTGSTNGIKLTLRRSANPPNIKSANVPCGAGSSARKLNLPFPEAPEINSQRSFGRRGTGVEFARWVEGQTLAEAVKNHGHLPPASYSPLRDLSPLSTGSAAGAQKRVADCPLTICAKAIRPTKKTGGENTAGFVL